MMDELLQVEDGLLGFNCLVKNKANVWNLPSCIDGESITFIYNFLYIIKELIEFSLLCYFEQAPTF